MRTLQRDKEDDCLAYLKIMQEPTSRLEPQFGTSNPELACFISSRYLVVDNKKDGYGVG